MNADLSNQQHSQILKKKINFLKENFLLIFTVNFLYIFHLTLINLILLLTLFYFFLCLISLFQTL